MDDQIQLNKVHIRWMIRRDMPEVLQIEQSSFEYPWLEKDFIRRLRQRNCIGNVAELGEKIVGFMVYELQKPKLHIINFAVHAEHRRCGIGTSMAEKLVKNLHIPYRTEIYLEIRETNLNSQLFFRSVSFRATRVLHKFYNDTDEDAFMMVYRLKKS